MLSSILADAATATGGTVHGNDDSADSYVRPWSLSRQPRCASARQTCAGATPSSEIPLDDDVGPRSVTIASPRGAQRRASVGPKIATPRAPTAAARCVIPLSLPT